MPGSKDQIPNGRSILWHPVVSIWITSMHFLWAAVNIPCLTLPRITPSSPPGSKMNINPHFDHTDNYCFFRCLALHQGARLHNLQIPTSALFKLWRGDQDLSSDFPGITLSKLERAEDLFHLSVDVFKYDETQSPFCLVPLRRSARKHPQNHAGIFFYFFIFYYSK